jgi:oxygen-independent coproporphyrinogen-3 oxidase
MEEIMLRARLAEGLPLTLLTPAALAAAERSRDSGLIGGAAYESGRLVLTRRGRLLADAVIRDLT